MSRELDRRDFSESKVTTDRKAELRSTASEVSDLLPGEQRIMITSFDATTGNPEEVRLEAAPVEGGDYVGRALDYLQSVSRALGIEATQPTEFAPDPQVQQTSSGAAAVHLHQLYKGIPIFEAAQAVRFAPNGAIQDSAGSSVTVSEEVNVSPSLSAEEAVLRAAQHVAEPEPDEQGATDQFGEPLPLASVDLNGFEPTVTATFSAIPDRPTVLESGPFEDEIRANLLWFPIDNDLRLAWNTSITMPNYEGRYRTIVDAETGRILYCRQVLDTIAGRGNVYVRDGAGARQLVDFPRPLADYGLPIPNNLPQGFPDDWVAVDRSVGNSTNAHQGDAGASIQGQVQNGVATFNPANATDAEQQVLNIFYYNCYMHDYFYLLGFREADGNFQEDNLLRGGIGGDRVDARSHPGPVWGTANMFTPVDGQDPIMNMGLVSSTNRHTAFDSTVVFHEFMHGVTNRLVGGPQNVSALNAPQSGGMGEGWGDYVACVINNITVVGAWVVNRPGGIRGFAYDSNFPDDFGDLGTGRYTGVHNVGEVWCATLMEMTRNIGKNLAVRLVVDALKLSPANPSFLNMRDAILRALDNMLQGGAISTSEHTSARRGTWQAFAKFGMGPGAQSNGAQLTGIVADFNEPAALPTGPTAQGDDMQPGEVLKPGESVRSADGQYTFVYQGDGNLVLYRNRDGRPLWASNTYGRSVGVCIMQGDGNLVIYDANVNAIWASGTWGNANSRLVAQGDGNVVIYRPDGRAIWSTNTWVPTGPTPSGDDMQPGEVLSVGGLVRSADGRYTFVYQGDGNLVLYRNSDRKALWASNTSGRPSGVCIMQGDGNLVIYSPGGNAVWASNTWGNANSRLVAQGDGNVVIYRPDGRAIWSTNTWVPTGPTPSGDDMQPGEVLNVGGLVRSADGQYTFVYQGDGNLVLYRNRDGKPLWASNTSGRPSGVCIMQGDGNLVIYSPGGNAVWASNTWGNANSRLVAQGDGNVVIYRPDGRAIWSTNTWVPTGPTPSGDDMQPSEVLSVGGLVRSADGRYTFVYQGDGNLVLYRNSDRRALWASGTYGKPSGVCIMQGDGNLVIYSPGGNAVWASNTWGNANSRLVAQGDGNVVIYRPDGRAIWSTNTVQP